MGIARCFTFGGAKRRKLHDPRVAPREGLSREEYACQAQAAQNTTINHFYEKLLTLKVSSTGACHRATYPEDCLPAWRWSWGSARHARCAILPSGHSAPYAIW